MARQHYSDRVSSPTETETPPTARELSLPVRQPYNARGLFRFLEGRVVPGIEEATGHCYRRLVDGPAWIEGSLAAGELRITIPPQARVQAVDAVRRLRRIFDLDADSDAIDRHLSAEPRLAEGVRAKPGLRIPGVWDPFEGAVRAILGQQVSVARATRLAALLCERFGGGRFPSARSLADVDVAAIGIPGMRGRAIAAVAARVVDEGVGWLEDAETLRAVFAEIPGLGPWTAEYAAMRVSRDPDAFPDSDWGVVKALGVKGAAARQWAEPCRPWRAYAVMHLWSSLAE